MLTKLLNHLSLEYNNLKNKSVLFILIVLSFLIRLPFFFRDYIDRDESTFIIMGQSWVNGHLPYLELWKKSFCHTTFWSINRRHNIILHL